MGSAIDRWLVASCLAILLLASSELILIAGATGALSNKYVTGCLIFAPLVLIQFATPLRFPVLTIADVSYIVLIFGITMSWAKSPWPAELREIALLVITLFAYAACRRVDNQQFDKFVEVSGLLAAALTVFGAFFTTIALVKQWNDLHGHILVFGSNAAPTNFAYSLGIFLIYAVTRRLTAVMTFAVCAFIFFPTLIFAASLVRFVFIAILGILLLQIIMCESNKQRINICAIAITLAVSMTIGFSARYEKTKLLIAYTLEPFSNEVAAAHDPISNAENGLSIDLPSRVRTKIPSCRMSTNRDNSIAIRKAAFLDSLYLLPFAGFFGLGLDSFSSLSCTNTNVHISIFQAFLEFGWIGGAAFASICLFSSVMVLRYARADPHMRALLLYLAFFIALAGIYGRFSREYALFALLGISVSLIESKKRDNKSATFYQYSDTIST